MLSKQRKQKTSEQSKSDAAQQENAFSEPRAGSVQPPQSGMLRKCEIRILLEADHTRGVRLTARLRF